MYAAERCAWHQCWDGLALLGKLPRVERVHSRLVACYKVAIIRKRNTYKIINLSR